MKKIKVDPNERIEAQWCVDSETGQRTLICIDTGTILYRLPINCKVIEDCRTSAIKNTNRKVK